MNTFGLVVEGLAIRYNITAGSKSEVLILHSKGNLVLQDLCDGDISKVVILAPDDDCIVRKGNWIKHAIAIHANCGDDLGRGAHVAIGWSHGFGWIGSRL